MPFLLRFIIRNEAATSPILGGTMSRVSSPAGIFSILMTSAPMSASISVQVGPAMTCVRSTTFNPDKGPIVSPAISCFYFVRRLFAGRDSAYAVADLASEVGFQGRGVIHFAGRLAGKLGFRAGPRSIWPSNSECKNWLPQQNFDKYGTY